MRPRYDTRALVLSRTPLGETSALITMLTPELGLVRARAQGIRQPGAKLAHALTTFSESDVTLLRGKEGWRVAGAILVEAWLNRLSSGSARERAGRVCGLLLRLVAGEQPDSKLFPIITGFLEALSDFSEEEHEQIEILAALYALRALGLDTGEAPPAEAFSQTLREHVVEHRMDYIARVNRGIQASGL